MVADLLSPNRCNWEIAKVKNYNRNVTEVLDSTSKKKFSRNFQFHGQDPNPGLWSIWNPIKKIAKLVRDKNHKTEPICVELFLRLRIKQVEQRKGKDEKDKDRKKIDRNQVSRAQNKQRKKEAKLAKEMIELQAAENQQDRIWFSVKWYDS